MHVSNERSGGLSGAVGELLRLQTEFQTRLAEETLQYLRRLQGAAAPATPGTLLKPEEAATVTASGTPGSTATLQLELENRQRVHCVVTPVLAPLVDASGVTWFPATEPSPGSTLLAPDQVRTIEIAVALPPEIPAGTYRGALLLQGFGDGGVAVSIEVTKPKPPAKSAAKPRAKPAAKQRRTRAS